MLSGGTISEGTIYTTTPRYEKRWGGGGGGGGRPDAKSGGVGCCPLQARYEKRGAACRTMIR